MTAAAVVKVCGKKSLVPSDVIYFVFLFKFLFGCKLKIVHSLHNR